MFFVKGDITAPSTVLQVLKDHQVDAVIHLAAQTHVDNSFGNSFTFTVSNVLGTHVLLEACKQVHPQVKRFLHVSTDEVYGENRQADHEFLESDALEPTNPYSATKAAAESIVKAYHRSFGIPVVIARPNNVYGPRQFPEKVIPKFIRQLESGLALTIHGNGGAQRSFLHVLDVVHALTNYILIRGSPGEVYNIGAAKVMSVLELATDLCRIFGVPSNFSYVPDRAYNDQRYHISSRKLRAELGWPGPAIEWESGLKATVQWYSDHPAFWENEDGAIVAHPRLGEDNTACL
jgi:UDP-glucose 4,6-dehydratase